MWQGRRADAHAMGPARGAAEEIAAVCSLAGVHGICACCRLLQGSSAMWLQHHVV